jgi:methionyl-tRNA synthetase
MPETKDNDFSWHDFQKRNDEELVAVLSNFVYRTLKLTEQRCGRHVPYPSSTSVYSEYIREAKESLERCFSSLDHFRFREGLKEYMNIARIGNRLLSDTEPWKQSPETARDVLFASLQLVYLIGYGAQIFLPNTAEKVKNLLDLTKWDSVNEIREREFYVSSQKELRAPMMLFRKIEKELIAVQKQKLEGSEATQKQEENHFLSIEEFQKVKLRVGTVLHAEYVSNAEKLLKLQVDLGEGSPRTIVSGIAPYYKPEVLIGKQVVVVANLKPKVLRGIESQGMILMVNDEEKGLLLLSPEKQVRNGSSVE